MIAFPLATLVLLGAAFAALLLASCWFLYTGLSARAAAAAQVTSHGRLRALVENAPAQALVVRADGRIDISDRLVDWLGLARTPNYLTDLSTGDAGLAQEDVRLLTDEVSAAQKAGRPFALAVRARGSSRTLLLRGQRAAREVAPGGVVIWAFDATESQSEIARLGEERGRLHEAFEALTGLIESAPLPMWYRGPDLRLQMVNSAYVTAVEGASAEDVVLRGLELVEASGTGGPLAGAVVARDRERPQLQTIPATIGGKRRMLRVHDVPLPIGGIAGFAIDVEDLEQARADAKRFADAQRGMLDRLSAAVAQFGPDRTLIFCNQPFRRLFAMRSEWLADRPEFDRVLERMRESNRLPEVRDFPGWKAERRGWFVATSGGQEENWHLPSGVHLRVVAQPLPDGGLLLVFEDRTEQVQLASARDTLLRVRTATFDNLFEALGVFGADGRLQLWNNRFRQVWGFEEEFLTGHPRVDALADAAAIRLVNPTRAALIPELIRSATLERQQRGGRVAFADGRHFEFGAVPLPDGNALLTMLDISDSRRIEQALRDRNEALEAADRVKTSFVAHMSYELRTPLTSISGFAEMLGEGYAGKLSRQANSYVSAILESVQRLGTLIDDVLDLTQNESTIERLDVNLVTTARGVADAMRASAQERDIDFAVEVMPSAGDIIGDPRRLHQAIEHLLRHAFSVTPAGGRVLLRADGTKARARVIVSDNGPGMTEVQAAHAFDRFSDTGLARSGERALGLDLPLARQFVEAHGGTISLVTEIGQGTLITVELPRR